MEPLPHHFWVFEAVAEPLQAVSDILVSLCNSFGTHEKLEAYPCHSFFAQPRVAQASLPSGFLGGVGEIQKNLKLTLSVNLDLAICSESYGIYRFYMLWSLSHTISGSSRLFLSLCRSDSPVSRRSSFKGLKLTSVGEPLLDRFWLIISS